MHQECKNKMLKEKEKKNFVIFQILKCYRNVLNNVCILKHIFSHFTWPPSHHQQIEKQHFINESLLKCLLLSLRLTNTRSKRLFFLLCKKIFKRRLVFNNENLDKVLKN